MSETPFIHTKSLQVLRQEQGREHVLLPGEGAESGVEDCVPDQDEGGELG